MNDKAFLLRPTTKIDGVDTPVGKLLFTVYDRESGDVVGLSCVVDDERFIIPLICYEPERHISAMDNDLSDMRDWLASVEP